MNWQSECILWFSILVVLDSFLFLFSYMPVVFECMLASLFFESASIHWVSAVCQVLETEKMWRTGEWHMGTPSRSSVWILWAWGNGWRKSSTKEIVVERNTCCWVEIGQQRAVVWFGLSVCVCLCVCVGEVDVGDGSRLEEWFQAEQVEDDFLEVNRQCYTSWDLRQRDGGEEWWNQKNRMVQGPVKDLIGKLFFFCYTSQFISRICSQYNESPLVLKQWNRKHRNASHILSSNVIL